MSLLYTDTGAHIPGIPARDLTDAEVERIAVRLNLTPDDLVEALLDSKLYAAPTAAPSIEQAEEPANSSEDDE